MFVLKCLVLTAAVLVCSAQQGPTTTPVPILKQINKQNDDGSYSYGYEAADGSFKIETKYPNGDVAGKYGYVDETGKLREISYGASSQRGFEPQGSGIMVPPPTLHDPTSSNALTDGQEDDGQYREDPKIYEDPKYNGRAQNRPVATFKQFHQPAQPEPQRYTQPEAPTFQPAQRYTSTFEAAPQYQPTQTSNFRSGPLFSQQSSLFSQTPQQFPQENRPQSQVYHTQPQFSYQAYQPQPQSYQPQPQSYQPQPQSYQPQYQQQAYQPQYQQSYQQQNYQGQNFNPFVGHPAQNFDPNTGSYSINFTG